MFQLFALSHAAQQVARETYLLTRSFRNELQRDMRQARTKGLTMERRQKHWTSSGPHQRAPRTHNASVELDETDLPIGDGPCDGMTAGDLFRLHGNAAAEAICERVAKNGGRTR